MLILWRRKFFKYEADLKGNFYAMERFRDFFSFRPCHLILTLTYIIMDNLCKCSHKPLTLFYSTIQLSRLGLRQFLLHCIKWNWKSSNHVWGIGSKSLYKVLLLLINIFLKIMKNLPLHNVSIHRNLEVTKFFSEI